MNSLAEHDDSDTLPDPWQHGMDDICDNDETSVPPTSSSLLKALMLFTKSAFLDMFFIF